MIEYSIDEIKESVINTFGFAVPDAVISLLADLFQVDEDSVMGWLLDDN